MRGYEGHGEDEGGSREHKARVRASVRLPAVGVWRRAICIVLLHVHGEEEDVAPTDLLEDEDGVANVGELNANRGRIWSASRAWSVGRDLQSVVWFHKFSPD